MDDPNWFVSWALFCQSVNPNPDGSLDIVGAQSMWIFRETAPLHTITGVIAVSIQFLGDTDAELELWNATDAPHVRLMSGTFERPSQAGARLELLSVRLSLRATLNWLELRSGGRLLQRVPLLLHEGRLGVSH